jgi:hypothetical protein
MSDQNVTPIRPLDVPPPSLVIDRAFSALLDDLNAVHCTLACASLALGQAQDEDVAEESRVLGAKAWTVVHRCAEELDRLHNAFDRWHVDLSHKT